MAESKKQDFRFEVALSFAGENRALARDIAVSLQDEIGNGKVFYDEWFEAELARPNLDSYVQHVYRNESRLVVVCIGAEYQRKPWTQLEWNAIQSLERDLRDPEVTARPRLRLLPLRVGDGDISGIMQSTVVPDIRKRPIEDVVRLIVDRLNRLRVDDGLALISDQQDKKTSIEPEVEPISEDSGEVFISYSWNQDGVNPLVDRLCTAITSNGYRVIRDKSSIELGDRISKFMDRVGDGACIVVVLSEPYLQSDNCMYELFRIYTNATLDDERFLKRVIPLAQSGVKLSRPIDRIQYAVYWKQMRDELESSFKEYGIEVFGTEDYKALRRMIEFAFHVSDMLAYMNDRCIPRNAEEIEADDFKLVIDLIRKAL